jgi:glycine oxidase
MDAIKVDVAIIGAGAIGCAIAYFLSKEGMKTIVVEKDSIGAHASGYAPGLLHPLGGVAAEFMDTMLPITTLSFQMHKKLYQHLPEESGIDYHFRQSTLFRLAFNNAEAKVIKEEVEALQSRGFKIRWLDGESLHQEVSKICLQVIGAACYKDVAEVDSYRYVLALAQAAEKCGAEIRHGQFLGMRREGSKLAAIQLSSGEIACDFVVLAMGPWTGLASSLLGFTIPVKPEKGQTIRIRASGPPFTAMLAWNDFYCSMTRYDGLIYYGATHEDAGFNEQPTVEGRDTLINSLVHMTPSLEEAQVVLQTACLRPLTDDKLPIIGKVPGWEGVYLATGHWTKGILLSPVTARIIADLIIKGSTLIPISPFTVNRFSSYNPG